MGDENYIERAQKDWKLDHGEDITPDQMVELFPLFGPERRAAALRNIDSSLENAGTGNLKSYAQQTNLRRKLGRLHQDLLGVDR